MRRLLFLISLVCLSGQLLAVNYCASQSWGYAGTSVTGGGSASPTLVNSASSLKSNLKSDKVIIITQSLTIDDQISTDASNMTILALPGVRLISNSQTKDKSGILYLKGSNIILRNITFEGPGAYDCDGKDLLTLDGAKNVWVDHCDFQDGMDGNFDIKGKSDNITVTWCRFRYLKAPKSGGSGGADDHRFSNLVGSSSTDKPADGMYNITYGFCWWDEGCKQRMTRCRNALIHYLNCYWNSSVADYYVGPENVSSYFEGCTFAGKANSAKNIYKAFNNTTNYCKFVNCTGNLPSDAGSVSTPSYTFDHLSASDAKNAVINSSCGAGATLNVTNTGAVSSSCDSGDTPVDPPTQDTIVVSGDCCVNLGLGAEPTVNNGGIPADFNLLTVTANMTKSTWDAGFLNFGGNADYITFDFSAYSATIAAVEFDVTIPNWTAEKNTIAYHWNSNANTQYTISSAAKETVSLQAPEDAKSFTIQRSAGTSTRIGKVCFEILGNEDTGFETVQQNSAAQKVLRQSCVFIVRDGKTYNLLGARVE